MVKKYTIENVFEKLREVGQLNRAKTDILYMEIHKDVIYDLLCDPEIESYLGTSTIYTKERIEDLFRCKVLEHTDNAKRDLLTFTYRADVLLDLKEK